MAPIFVLAMRKFIVTLFATFMVSILSGVDMMAVSKASLMALINDARSYDGVEVVKIGGLGTAALKSLIKFGALVDDEDARNAMEIIKGINKFVVLEYEGCNAADRTHINARIKEALNGSELLMEVKDGDDNMQMYGVVDDDSSVVRDFVMFDSQGCALVCLFGHIRVDAVMKLAE